MRYTYDVIDAVGNEFKRIMTTTNFNEIKSEHYTNHHYVAIYDNLHRKNLLGIHNRDDYESWEIMLERGIWMKDKVTGFGDIVADSYGEKVIGKRTVTFHNATSEVTKDRISLAVDPPHYQGYIGDYQWIDAMSRIPTLRDPIKFKAALELQIRKYLDRNGHKDDEIQELKKAKWYLNYLIKYIENGNKPIQVKDL